MLSRLEKTLIASISVSFLCYLVGVLIGNELFKYLFSPLTVGLTMLLLISELGKLGPFKWSSVALAVGMFIWFLADIILFYAAYMPNTSQTIYDVIDTLYLLPDACIATCLSIYMFSMLKGKGNELTFLIANTLCFAICAFVLIYRFHVVASGDRILRHIGRN